MGDSMERFSEATDRVIVQVSLLHVSLSVDGCGDLGRGALQARWRALAMMRCCSHGDPPCSVRPRWTGTLWSCL